MLFCPNKQPSFEPLNCLDRVGNYQTSNRVCLILDSTANQSVFVFFLYFFPAVVVVCLLLFCLFVVLIVFVFCCLFVLLLFYSGNV